MKKRVNDLWDLSSNDLVRFIRWIIKKKGVGKFTGFESSDYGEDWGVTDLISQHLLVEYLSERYPECIMDKEEIDKSFKTLGEEITYNRISHFTRFIEILPYLEEFNNDLHDLYESGPNGDMRYDYMLYEIQTHLDFIASSLTNEDGDRFGGSCGDGHIFKLLHLYEDSLKVSNKTIQEKIMLKIYERVCSGIIVTNGNGATDLSLMKNRYRQYALENCRMLIGFLLDEHSGFKRHTNTWVSLDDVNNHLYKLLEKEEKVRDEQKKKNKV
ncbi:hypothetical protein BA6E_104157 [Bacteroidales bacterium 6E]|nr:hypothetical protein BA6E_104157 [Bacteroidales bacterium 6E]